MTVALLIVAALAALLALAALAWGSVWWAERRRQRAGCTHVLLYHRLVPPEQAARLERTEALFGVAADRFAEHLDALSQAGYEWVQADELTPARAGSGRHVAICFDDGCESVYRLAFPELKRRGISATVFVTACPDSWVFSLPGNPQRRLSSDELRQLHGAGWRIGTHGMRHAPPSAMSAEELERDLRESREILQDEIQARVTHHAVPGNFTATYYEAAARNTGHEAIWTAKPGALTPRSSPWHLPRLNIESHLTGEQLVASLRPGAIATRRLIYQCKRLPARLLGPRLWLPIRAALFRSPLGRYLTYRHLRAALAAGLIAAVAMVVAMAFQ